MDQSTVVQLSLAFTVILQIGIFSFLLGGLFQRVKSHGARIGLLEDHGNTAGAHNGNIQSALARLETTFEIEMRHLQEQVAELRGASPPSRPRPKVTGDIK